VESQLNGLKYQGGQELFEHFKLRPIDLRMSCKKEGKYLMASCKKLGVQHYSACPQFASDRLVNLDFCKTELLDSIAGMEQV
jgi:hypothetical protein